jgi:uncharacterized protein YutE (UPF0331/DUF86 family)
MSIVETRERDFLENLLPQYEADGFTVFLHPSSAMLPPFMEGYRPDAIAIKSDKKIVIEVKRDTSSAKTNIKQISEIFAQHPEWELRVYYIPGRPQEKTIEVLTPSAIENSIREVLKLRHAGRLTAALILAWATLEAIGRALLPEQLARPQPAGRLIEVLASEGLLTASEADTLRRAVDLRNAATHGHLDQPVTVEQVDELIAAVQLLAGMLAQGPSRG